MHRRSIIRRGLAYWFSFLVFPSYGLAAPEQRHVAKVERISGQAFGVLAGVTKPLVVGQRLVLGMEIVTGEIGAIRLRLLASNALVILGHRSSLRLDDRQLDVTALQVAVTKTKILALRLMHGALRYLSATAKSELAKQQVSVVLPTATVGIRGTDFYAESENRQDIVCLFDGLIDVIQQEGRVFELRQPLDFYRASHDGARSEQSRAEPHQVSRWKGRFFPLGLSGDPPPDDSAAKY